MQVVTDVRSPRSNVPAARAVPHPLNVMSDAKSSLDSVGLALAAILDHDVPSVEVRMSTTAEPLGSPEISQRYSVAAKGKRKRPDWTVAASVLRPSPNSSTVGKTTFDELLETQDPDVVL